MITNIILILTSIYAWYLIIKEIIWLHKFCNRWLYVYKNKSHSHQHILMLILMLLYWIIMNWLALYDSNHYIMSFIYNLLLIPLVVRHLYLERINNLNN